MDMSKKEYQQFVQDRAKKSPLLKDCTLAFLIGGAICVLGQLIQRLIQRECDFRKGRKVQPCHGFLRSIFHR